MEVSQALQRCVRSTLYNSTRHTLRVSPSCLHSTSTVTPTTSRRAFTTSDSKPTLRDLLQDFKRETSTNQSINEKLDNLPWASSARSPQASNLRALDGSLGQFSGASTGPNESAFLAELNKGIPDFYDETQLRLRPSLGRTVNVTGADPGRAFRTLERKCAENKVRVDEKTQKFHIRKGQLKKLLKAQRWRALFKEGFIAECQKIRRMRKQGW